MRLRNIIFFAFALVLSSCYDNSYEGRGVWGIDKDGNIKVVVAIDDPSGSIFSKGSGALDEIDDMFDKKIYVLAYNNLVSSSYKNPDYCLVDGSGDGLKHGKMAEIVRNDPYVRWEGNPPYWRGGENYSDTYDFFAYYIDDDEIVGEVTRSDNAVALDLTIDGTQDVMHSKGVIHENQLKNMSQKDKDLYRGHAFSYFTAYNNIVPVFQFTHDLVKLSFEVMPGVTLDMQNELKISAVKVNSKNNASFVVASHKESALGLRFKDSYALLDVTEEGGERFDEEKYTFRTLPSSSASATPFALGAGVMVAPQDSYDVQVYVMVKKEGNSDYVKVVGHECQTLHVTYPEGFTPGSQYIVRMSVAGPMNITFTVTAENWDYGGKFADFDPNVYD